MFGIGPDSTPAAPMNPAAAAAKASTITSGSAVSPTQYAASGVAIAAAMPTIVAGR